MPLGFGVGAGLCGVIPKGDAIAVQKAGVTWGPMSSVNFWQGPLGVGYDLQDNRTFVIHVYRRYPGAGVAVANNQTTVGFDDATTGWVAIAGNSHNVNMFALGGSGGSTGIADIYFGHCCIAIKQVAGVRYESVNGSPIQTVGSIGTYTNGGASARMGIGKNAGTGASPATQQDHVNFAVIDAALSDADLQTVSGAVNGLDPWHVDPIVKNHANLVWLLDAEGWDGSSATYAGSGSAPITMTRQGTGGARNVIPAFLEYVIPFTAIADNVDNRSSFVTGETGFIHSSFARTFFQSGAADLANGLPGMRVKIFANAWVATGVSNAGISVDGVNLAGNNVGLEPGPGLPVSTGYGLNRVVDVPGIPSGAGKQFILTDGLNTKAGSVIGSVSTCLTVRIPATDTLTWNAPTAPAEHEIAVSDSIGGQITNVTDTASLDGPPYRAYTPLGRAKGRRISHEGWGFGTWVERISGSVTRSGFVDKLVQHAIGTNRNRYWMQMGTNDFGLSGYASMASFTADLVAMLTDLMSRGVPGAEVWMVSPTTRTDLNESTPIAGLVLNDFREAIRLAVLAVNNPLVHYVDGRDLIATANRGDGLHPTKAGYLEYFNKKEIAMYRNAAQQNTQAQNQIRRIRRVA